MRQAPSNLSERRISARQLHWGDNSEIVRNVVEFDDTKSTGSSNLTEIWESSTTVDVVTAVLSLALYNYKNHDIPEAIIVDCLKDSVSEIRVARIIRSLSMSARGHIPIFVFQLNRSGIVYVNLTPAFRKSTTLLKRTITHQNELPTLARRAIADHLASYDEHMPMAVSFLVGGVSTLP